MTVLVTQSALRTRIRAATQQPNVNGAISDQTLNGLIREGAYELYDLLIAARGSPFFAEQYGLNTVPGQRTYALPERVYRLTSIIATDTPSAVPGGGLRGFDYPGGSPVFCEVLRLNQAEHARQESRFVSHPSQLRYTLTGTQNSSGGTTTSTLLRFHPAPAGLWNVQLLYLPKLDTTPDPVSGEVVYDGIHGWEQFVEAHACSIVAAMQEEDPGFWMARKAEQKDRIRGLATDRDASAPLQVQDRRFRRGRSWR